MVLKIKNESFYHSSIGVMHNNWTQKYDTLKSGRGVFDDFTKFVGDKSEEDCVFGFCN
jgi:hypothetical protein